MLPKDYFEQNHIIPGHHITVPREVGPLRNSADLIQLQDVPVPAGESSHKVIDAGYFGGDSSYDFSKTAYSEELANGDSMDNRDIHEEEDM